MKLALVAVFLSTFFIATPVFATNYIDPLSSCDDSIDEVDRAKIFYSNADGYDLYATNSLCHRCSMTLVAKATTDGSYTCASMFTPHMWKLYIVNSQDPSASTADPVSVSKTTCTFGDEGEYHISTNPNDNFAITVTETNSPMDAMFPLYVLIGVLVAVVVGSFGIPILYDKYTMTKRQRRDESKSRIIGTAHNGMLTEYSPAEPLIADEDRPAVRPHTLSHSSMEEVPIHSPPASSPHVSTTTPSANLASVQAGAAGKKPERLQSLDSFRGFSLCLMIFVNYGGGGYWFFEHAAWNGLTFADLLFPWFMWIMGVSMALSFVTILKTQPRTPETGRSIIKYLLGYGKETRVRGSGASDMRAPSPSVHVTSGQDSNSSTNPRDRSGTNMSQHSLGTGFDAHSMRSSVEGGALSSMNSVRSISNASNASASGLNSAASITSLTQNPLPDYVPPASASNTTTSRHQSPARQEVDARLQENTLYNANLPEDSPALPFTLCNVDLIIWWRVVRRSVILFLIGMFLANGYEYSTWRIPGVLQYFAVSYCITGFTILSVHSYTKERLAKLERDYAYIAHTQTPVDPQSVWVKWEALFGKNVVTAFTLTARAKILTAYYYEWIIQAAVLLIYLSIVFGAKIAGCPRGYNGPGGISDHTENGFCTGGIHRYIDMKFFTWQLIYHHPTCLDLYQCQVYDPEGLLGSMMACTLTYLGLMAGRVVLHFPEHNKRMAAWVVAGCVLLFIAGCLCGFAREGGVIPINKNLWSTSFVAVTAGGGLVLLAVFYYFIDKLKVWTGAPFRYLGMNSILIYCGHSLLAEYMPFSYKIYHVNHGTLLQCHVLGTLSWVIIAWYCFSIKFFVKV